MSAELNFKMTIYMLCILIAFNIRHTFAAKSQLELLQIVYRHGDRTPTKPFPTDPNMNTWLTIGFGQLTNIGKEQHYRLGQFIRNRYKNYLNDIYNRSEIYVQSTDVDRTLMSAECNMAGMYPPEDSEIWNEDLLWQPIPIHTLPTSIDYVFDDAAPCPKYDELLHEQYQSPEMKEIDRENQDLYELLTRETGLTIYNISKVGTVFSNLLAAKCHNLSLPEWATPSIYSRMAHCEDVKFVFRSKTLEMCRLLGGPLLGRLLENIAKKVNGSLPAQKAFFYSSHDTLVSALMSSLGVYDNLAPPYASAVFVELLKDPSGSYGVQFSYRNSTTAEPFVLTVPNCTSTCPLDQLVDLTRNVISDDVVAECAITNDLSKK